MNHPAIRKGAVAVIAVGCASVVPLHRRQR